MTGNTPDKRYQIKGRTQADRVFGLPSPDTARPDDWTMERLLAFITSYSELINYYNYQNQIEGNWKEFFYGDILVSLAIISQNKTDGLWSGFAGGDKFYSETESEQNKNRALDHIIFQAYDIIKKVNKWSVALQWTTDHNIFKTELENSIDRLFSKMYVQLKTEIVFFAYPTEIAQPQLSAELWPSETFAEYDPDYLDTLKAEHPVPPDGGYGFPEMAEVFTSSLMSIHKGYVYLINQAKKEYNRLLEKNDHPPHIGLLLTFLKLYAYPQEALNEFPSRLITYYYTEVLRCVPMPGTPDTVHVSFTLKETSRGLMLPKGTGLSAGKDSRQIPVVYTTTSDLWIGKATLQNIYSLYLQKDSLVNKLYKSDIVTGLFLSSLSSKIINTVAGEGESWPVFGTNYLSAPESKSQQTTIYAETGFAVASSVLCLSEGTREIVADIILTAESYASLETQLHTVSQEVDVPDDTLSQIISYAFAVRYTTAKGWTMAQRCTVDLVPEKNALQFRISLFSSDEAITAYNSDIHGAGYPSVTDPVMEFRLVQGNYLCAYSFLQDLQVREIAFSVSVRAVRSLNIYNENGKIDPGKPFPMLGVIPTKGSYMLVGHEELFLKPVTYLAIHIKWSDVSLINKGWQEYYRGYPMQVSNNSFRLGFSMLTHGSWIPFPGGPSNFPMFVSTTEDPDGPPTDTLDIEAGQSGGHPLWAASTTPVAKDYSISAGNGFLKLELTAPDVAFGQSLYTEALSTTILNNARAAKDKQQPIPNKPYTPTVRSITLDYDATASIKLDQVDHNFAGAAGGFFHISPWTIYDATSSDIKAGNERKEDSTAFVLPQLIPSYSAEGTLLLGLTNVDAGESVSLLFDIIPPETDDPGNDSAAEEEMGSMTWQYLSGDVWKDFTPDLRPVDNTNGFLRSGIIQLILPDDCDTIHNLMPAGQCWIKAMKPEGIENTGYITGIWINAVSAVYSPADEEQFLSRPLSLPPNSIKQLITPVDAVKTVVQPYYSQGGIMSESAVNFRLRMAERLRHKQRAILPADYEMLVLQQFPHLFKAVCIGQKFVHEEITPGTVRLVVIPKVHELQGTNLRTPRLPLSDLIEIKEFVAQYTSPLINVQVINPLYEVIQVRCQAIFRGGAGVTFNIRSLGEAITDYLCPWISNPDADVQTGGVLSLPDLINFIESQPYVAGVRKFSVLRVYKDDGEYNIREFPWPEFREIQAFAPWSVFASAEAHIITQEDDATFPEAAGVGSLGIGSNFIVNPGDDGSGVGFQGFGPPQNYIFTLDVNKLIGL